MIDNNLFEKIKIDDVLASGKSVRIHLQGYSMYPLIIPEKDEVVISPLKNHNIRRGDVLLFRRKSGKQVLHRVFRVNGSKLYFVGDNQSEIEGPISLYQVYGIMTGFYKKKIYFSVHNPFYILSWKVWLFLLPDREKISNFIHKLKTGNKS
ncbi:MAG: S24/S26 family peptidase [Lachnospiraceae bacterium]|nr:S24/S26 family peptidase [Lachnospiraceae bacterium]